MDGEVWLLGLACHREGGVGARPDRWRTCDPDRAAAPTSPGRPDPLRPGLASPPTCLPLLQVVEHRVCGARQRDGGGDERPHGTEAAAGGASSARGAAVAGAAAMYGRGAVCVV
eukprot:XP_001697585.1 predicted protein [Chlamydomonas reinhardtii]